MKKTLLILILSLPLVAQTTVVSATWSEPNAVVTDLLTWARLQVSNPSPAATLVGSIGTTDTTFTISSATGYTATDLFANAGATLVIESEEITCTTLTGAVYSGCSRHQQLTTAATHSAGVSVTQMKYATGNSQTKALLAPGTAQALASLGAASTYIASLVAAQTTATNNLIAAIAVIIQ